MKQENPKRGREKYLNPKSQKEEDVVEDVPKFSQTNSNAKNDWTPT